MMAEVRKFRNLRTGRRVPAVLFLELPAEADQTIWLVAPTPPFHGTDTAPVRFGDRVEPSAPLVYLWSGDWELEPTGGRVAAEPTEQPDYMVTFLEFWRPLVTDALGHLDLDRVARELHDYRQFMDGASEVYEHIAGLTKPNTAASHIIAAHEQKLSDAYDEGHADALAELSSEPPAAE